MNMINVHNFFNCVGGPCVSGTRLWDGDKGELANTVETVAEQMYFFLIGIAHC